MTNYIIRRIISIKGGVILNYWLSSITLDACCLAIVEKEDAYGYVVTQQMKQRLDVSESTLYPVLRRLEKQKFLETYDKAYQGRNRRYYRITASGKKRLEEIQKQWEEYKQKIDKLLGGEKK